MKVIEEWAGHCYVKGHHDKIWAACYTDTGDYLVVWGARDSRYNDKGSGHQNSLATAQQLWVKNVNKKRHEYDPVNFNDPNHGSIISFSQQFTSENSARPAATTGTSGPDFTWATVLQDVIALKRRLKRDGAAYLNEAMMAWQIMKTKAHLFFEFGDLSASEKLRLVAGLKELEDAIAKLMRLN